MSKAALQEIDSHNFSPCKTKAQFLQVLPTKVGRITRTLIMLVSFVLNFYLLSTSLKFHQPGSPQQPVNSFFDPVHSNWCPNDAICLSSPLCRPCQRRFLIIITNGRSASTTLTWMLNLLPGVRMGGENNNAVGKLMKMIQTVTAPPFVLQPKLNPYHAWQHNPIPDGSLACVSQKFIETIVPPAFINATHTEPNEAEEIVGFKTIRLGMYEVENPTSAIVSFLKEHFPCARFIINIRSDLERQIQSQLFSFDVKPEYIKQLAVQMQRLKEMAQLLGSTRAKLIDSMIWTEDVSQLNQVVTWLGFDEQYCSFPKLMELNTGRLRNKLGHHHGLTNVTLDPRCRYIGRRRTNLDNH